MVYNCLHIEGAHSLKHFYRNLIISMSFIWVKTFEIMLQLLIAVHWLTKCLLNVLALASNSVISSLFTIRGGILGTFFPLHKVLSVA